MRVQDMGLGLDGSLPLMERLVGIEVEVERCFDSTRTPCYWDKKHDSSLREGGAEWVTPPIRKEEVPACLEALYSDFQEYEWRANSRTGIHVHVDVRDFTAVELQALAVAYALTERAFCVYVGQKREENIYCVPWYRAWREATAVMEALRVLESDPHQGAYLLHETVKYVGLYFEPIRRFGTVEFRHAPTWTYAERVQEWVDMCYALVEFAKECGTPEAVMALWESMLPAEFSYRATGLGLNEASWYNNGVSEGIALQMMGVLEPPDTTETDFFGPSILGYFQFEDAACNGTSEES